MNVENLLRKLKTARQESGLEPVVIPEILIERLKDFGKRYIKIRPPIADDKHSGKRAVELGFQNKPYAADDPEIQEWLATGGNYGILAGNGLIEIETDDKRMSKRIENRYRTLTVKSGRKDGKHFFFYSNAAENGVLENPKTHENIGNIQVDRKYVVGANCNHYAGGTYEIIDDSKVAYITQSDIEEIFGDYLVWHGKKRKDQELGALHDAEQAGAVIPMRDLINLEEMTALNDDEVNGSHPIHGSTTGTNFCVNLKKNVWHCFRCNSGGGGLMWIAVKEGIIKCSEAQAGALRGKKFLEAARLARDAGFDVNVKEEHVEPDVERFFIYNPNNTRTFVPKWVSDELMQEYTYITQKQGRVMFVYTPEKGIYELMAEQQIEETTQAKIGRHNSISRNKDIVDHIKRSTYKLLEDTPIELIALKNGLLNTKTRKMQEFSAEYFIINQFPVTHDPKARCPKFLKFLSEVMSKADIIILQEFFGFLLLRNYIYQKAVLMLGDGSNGKTTLLNVMEAFLGIINCANEPLQYLMMNRFAMGQLYGKLANIYDDLPEMALKNVGFFKILTGEGTVTAEFKFKDRFNFKNYAKMVFTCNVIPPCPEDTTAFFRRWIILNFPNTFTDDNKDPELFGKISTPEELSGVLNWALDGLVRLRKNEHFTDAGTVEEIRERYLASAEPVKSFAENCLEEAEGHTISKEDLYQAYREYCKKLKIKIVPKGTVTRLLPTYINATSNRRNWFNIIVKYSNENNLSIKDLKASQESILIKEKGCVDLTHPIKECETTLVTPNVKNDDEPESKITEWLKNAKAVKGRINPFPRSHCFKRGNLRWGEEVVRKL